MFSSGIPSSPVFEIENFMNYNSNKNNNGDFFDYDNSFTFNGSDYGLNVMMNQVYVNPSSIPSKLSTATTTVASTQQGDYFTENSIFFDAPPSIDEIPGTSISSASSSTELESLNFKFIQPQDIVNAFPSASACTPPLGGQSSSSPRKLSVPNFSFKELTEFELAHHHNQIQQHQQQLQQQAQQLQQKFSSSVESTPVASELGRSISSLVDLDEAQLLFSNEDLMKSESFGDEQEDIDSQQCSSGLDDHEQNEVVDADDEGEIPDIVEIKKYRVVRGVSSGGCATRPPKEAKNSTSKFVKVKLHLSNADGNELCLPEWNLLEREDGRRIIRVERRQNRENIVASFSVVGSAIDHPAPVPAPEGVDVVEVSCLECIVDENYDDFEDVSSELGLLSDNGSDLINHNNNHHNNSNSNINQENLAMEDFGMDKEIKPLESQIQQQPQQHLKTAKKLAGKKNGSKTEYYITSVEVIKIVELLIGSQKADGPNKRRERGRIRSNLVPFWSRKPVSSKKGLSPSASPIEVRDFRIELAQRIMGYETRKPRGFDKEVRILKWDKLVPALKRALQSYYIEIPELESSV